MSSFDIHFVCVGPQRTGTTWIYEMLRQHPELCLPEAVKETMFFDLYHDRGIDWYSQYFQHARPEQLHGEVAPTYFDASEAPRRIQNLSPNCRIVVTLRDPVERAWSLFLHHLKKGRVSENFWDAVGRIPRIVEAGHYGRHIPRWQSIFGPEQVTILFLEDIESRPRKMLRSIQRELGVEVKDLPEKRDKSLNGTSMSRYPSIARGVTFLTTKLHKYGLHEVVSAVKKTGVKSLVYTGGEERMPRLSTPIREILAEEYEKDIAFVEEETGRDLTEWRE